MKTLIIEDAGKLSFSEKQKPTASKGQVLIQIKAVALNHRDQYIREGKYPGINYGTTLGADACGQVIELGEEVDNKWLYKEVVINPNIEWGDNPRVQSKNYHILGTPTDGVFAEFVAIDENKIAEKPKHMSHEEAAALPLAGMTAFRALFHHGQLEKSQKVLISGVGGGVAQFAFQFALASTSEVYVTSGNAEKRAKCIELGAKGAFNYKEEDWTKQAKEQAGGFDLVIDSAGGSGLNDFIKLMKPAGRIVFYGATTGKPKDLDLFRMFWNQITLQGSTMASDQEFHQMIEFVNTHKIKPIIDSVVAFDEIISQFDKMKEGNQFGKLVAKL